MPTLDNMLTVCYGCRTLIDDRYYLMAVDRSWHLSCLKCYDCGMSLEQERTCFARYGQIFCKDDYIKRYCSRICTRCHAIIRQDEVILRAKQFIFHLDCFTCVTCNIPLHPGDEFGLKDDLIFCRHHFFEQQQQQQQQQSYDPHLTGRMIDIGIENHSLSHGNSIPPGFLDDSGYQTSPNETRQLKANEEHFLALSPTLFPYFELNDTQLNGSYHSKQKRLRTSFQHQQLRFMRSYFNLNHNPDAKELKNLSEKTNLSKRVLQVWFQNARAKYRRNNTLSRENRTNNYNQSETAMSPS